MSKFYLTLRANTDLLEIENYSTEKWGKKRSDQYMKDVYSSFKSISKNPEIGRVHLHRSLPFLMAPIQRHFVIYKTFEKGIVIATVLHGRRNIENIIRDMPQDLEAEINRIMRSKI